MMRREIPAGDYNWMSSIFERAFVQLTPSGSCSLSESLQSQSLDTLDMYNIDVHSHSWRVESRVYDAVGGWGSRYYNS